jgi:recombination protein RecR
MDAFQNLAELFRTFPGIGPRQAERFVYHLITSPVELRTRLIETLKKLNEETAQCRSCLRYFPQNHNAELCTICANPNRDASLLLVVARDRDITVIEKSGSYDGYYFVLGGTVPILDKNPENKIRLNELLILIENKVKNKLKI